ncbi:MAG: hypothetical protein IKY83_05850 [Proteobacteria bacterium]|nr:hypothetical protein [Pseudomonadota bacterium]
MTDHSIHKDNSIKDSLAQLQDYYEAQSQLACTRSFGTMPNVEKLYFLMTVVKRPTEFSVLSDIARLNGIKHGELCQFLVEFPRYFCELHENIWATTAYAEYHGYIHHTDMPHAAETTPAQELPDVADFFKKQSEQPIKNGILCMSQDEIHCAALAFCQSSAFRAHHNDNFEVLNEFMQALPRPIRASDLNDVVYNVFGFSVARSTLRKYLCKHPDLYCTPTHGVWCSEKLARETPYTDYRDKAQTDTKRPKQQ